MKEGAWQGSVNIPRGSLSLHAPEDESDRGEERGFEQSAQGVREMLALEAPGRSPGDRVQCVLGPWDFTSEPAP